MNFFIKVFLTILFTSNSSTNHVYANLVKLHVLNNSLISEIIVNESGRQTLYNSDSNNIFYIIKPRKEIVTIESFGYLPYHLKVNEIGNVYEFYLHPIINRKIFNVTNTIPYNSVNYSGNRRKPSHGKFCHSEGIFIGQKISYFFKSDVSNVLIINKISIYLNKIVSSIDTNYLVLNIFEIDNSQQFIEDSFNKHLIFSDTFDVKSTGWVKSYPNSTIHSGIFCYQVEYLEPNRHISKYTGLEHLGIGVYRVKFNKNVVKFFKSGRVRFTNSNLTFQTSSEMQKGQSKQSIYFNYSIN